MPLSRVRMFRPSRPFARLSLHIHPNMIDPDDPFGTRAMEICEDKMRWIMFMVNTSFKGYGRITNPGMILDLRQDQTAHSTCHCSVFTHRPCKHHLLTVDRCLSEQDWDLFKKTVDRFSRVSFGHTSEQQWRTIAGDMNVITGNFANNYSRLYNQFTYTNDKNKSGTEL